MNIKNVSTMVPTKMNLSSVVAGPAQIRLAVQKATESNVDGIITMSF